MALYWEDFAAPSTAALASAVFCNGQVDGASNPFEFYVENEGAWTGVTINDYAWSASPSNVAFTNDDDADPLVAFTNTTTGNLDVVISVLLTDDYPIANTGTLSETITIEPAPIAPTINQVTLSDLKVCLNGDFTFTFTGGTVGSTVTWEADVTNDFTGSEIVLSTDVAVAPFGQTGNTENKITVTGNSLLIENVQNSIDTWFFRVVLSNTCGDEATSAVRQLEVVQTSVARGISNTSPSICEDGTHTFFTTPPFVGEFVKWEYSPDGIAWHTLSTAEGTQNIVEFEGTGDAADRTVTSVQTTGLGERNLILTVVPLALDNYEFRMEWQNVPCAPALSAVATLEVVEKPKAAVLVSPAPASPTLNICQAGTITITLDDDEAVGTDSWWFYPTGGPSWTAIGSWDGANGSVTTSNSTTLEITGVAAGVDGFLFMQEWAASPCSDAYSTVVTVNVSPTSVAGTVSATSATTHCVGSTFAALANNTGSTGTYQGWYKYDVDASEWVFVTGSGENLVFSIENVTVADAGIYTAGWKSGECSIAYAAPTITLTVDATPVPRRLAASEANLFQTRCQGSMSVSFNTATETGSVDFDGWYYRTSLTGDWVVVAAGAIFDNGGNNLINAATNETVLVLDNVQPNIDGFQFAPRWSNGACDPVYGFASYNESLIPATLNVDPTPAAGTVTLDPVTLCAGGDFTATSTAGTGTIDRWQFRTSALGTWVDMSTWTATSMDNVSYPTSLSMTITSVPYAVNGYEFRAVWKSGVCTAEVPSADGVAITVNPLPAIGFSFDGTLAGTASPFEYCEDETITVTLSHIWSGTAPFSVTYQVNNETPVTVTALALNSQLFSNTMPVGTYTITITNITDDNGCSPTNYTPYSATVNVNPTPTATYALNKTITAGSYNYCVGEDIILSLASITAGTDPFNVGWSIVSTAPVYDAFGTANNVAELGTITNTTSLAAGTYTFAITSLLSPATGCQATGTLATFTVNVYAVPTVSAPTGGPFCAETNAVLTATTTNATLYQWEVSDTEAGTYTAILSGDTEYTGQTTDELTVLWDGGSKSEKWYRLSASNNGFCQVYGDPAQLLYTPLPDFTGAHPANVTACDNGPAEFYAIATYGTTWQWQILDGSWTDLTNDPPYSGVTTTTLSISDVTGLDDVDYRLVAWNDGCPVDGIESEPATLTVTPLPEFVSYIENTNPICESASVTFTANFDDWTLIVWERRVDDQSSWVEVTQNLDLGVYSFNNDGTELTINPPQGLDGYEYRARAYNEGCPTEGVAGDIIVLEVRNNTVARTVVEEEQSICETDGVIFTLEGTPVGTFVTWQYSPNEGANWFQIDNAVAPFTGLVVTENGTELELQDVPFAFDGYWFRAQYQNSPCNAASSANYGVLLVGTYPLAYTVTIVDEEICSGNETSVDLSDSEVGVEYQLFNDITAVGDPQDGTGEPLSWTVDETGIYTVVGYNAGCETDMTGSVELTVNLVPQVSGLPTENEIFVCEGSELSISGLTDDAGTYSYDWTTTAINGYTSSILNPGVINATADADDAGVYTLVVTNDVTGCETTIDITVTVLAEPETPVLADILVSDTDSETGDDYSTYCELDEPGTLYLHIDNAGGYGVEWATDNQFTNIIGTNNPESYTAPTEAGTTTLYVRRTTENCGDSEYLAFDIEVFATPAVLFSFNGVNASTGSEFEYCQGTELTVLLDSYISGSGIYNVNYNVYVDGSVTPDVTLSGSATDLEEEGTLFNSTLAPGEYLIEVTMLEDDVTGCTFPNPEDTYTATVTIIANPWATISVDEEACTGDEVEFDVTAGGGSSLWTVYYNVNGSPADPQSSGPTSNLTFYPVNPGNLTVEITSIVNDEGCVTTYAEGNRPTATVLILQTPAQPGAISGEDVVEQGAGDFVYSIDPVTGATGYTWGWSGDAPDNVSISGSGTSVTLNFPENAEIGDFTLSVYASNGICDGPVQTIDIEIIPEATPTKLRFVGVPTDEQESGVPFQVQIQSVDDNDVVRKVTNLTQFQITLQNGDGSFLSVSSSIAAGNSISSPINITYTLDDADPDEDDVRFLVARTSGDLLASGISHPDEEGEGLYYKRGAPTVQAKNIIFTSWNRSRINFSWTKGNGVYTLAVVKLGNDATLTAPTDGQSYSTNVSINLAENIGGGTKANYAGTGTASYASGLSSNTYYTFGVYSYNFVDPDELYNTSSATNNPRSAKTNSKEAEDSFTFFLGEFAVSEVYPNPAQTEINFSIESVNDLPFNIELFNMLGERVYADHKFLSQGTYNFSIPVHNETGGLPAGSYMLRISAGGETHSTSVIISR